MENESPQWRKHKWGLNSDEAIFQGKLVQRMIIDTREWKNLKLEKVFEEEYREKYKLPTKKTKGVLSNLTPLKIGLTAAALIPFVIFFIKKFEKQEKS